MPSAATPREQAIVSRIMRRLAREPATWAVKFHGTNYTRAGVPDIIGSHLGRAFGLEVKRPGQKPSLIQVHEMQKMANAGARVAVVESLEDALEVLGIAA